MSDTEDTTNDPLTEQAVIGTLRDVTIQWTTDDEYDSFVEQVELLANGWIRVPMEHEADQYYPPNEVTLITAEDGDTETTQTL